MRWSTASRCAACSRWRNVDMALLSATDLSAQSKMLEYEVISRETWQSLRDAGATGDICGHFLDIEGKPVDHPIALRTINPTLADLRGIPELILAAGGLQKDHPWRDSRGDHCSCRRIALIRAERNSAINLIGCGLATPQSTPASAKQVQHSSLKRPRTGLNGARAQASLTNADRE
jgi:Putative sugar-binding domain